MESEYYVNLIDYEKPLIFSGIIERAKRAGDMRETRGVSLYETLPPINEKREFWGNGPLILVQHLKDEMFGPDGGSMFCSRS